MSDTTDLTNPTVTTDLLDLLEFDHKILSRAPTSKGIPLFVYEMLIHCWRLFWMARQFKPTVMLQMGTTEGVPLE